jgi:hypothetical protein
MNNNPLIPANIVRKLGVNAKKTNQEVIIDYLTQEKGTVELNKTQKELYDRWDLADNLMRQRKYKKTEIAKMICGKFNVSIATARNDLAEAEYIFGSTRKFSKIYVLSNLIDQLEDKMVEAERRGDQDLVAKLAMILTKAISLMPDEMQKEIPPTKLVFNLTQNNTTNELYMPETFTEEDAKRVAAEKLKKLGIDLEPFELTQYLEVKDDEK